MTTTGTATWPSGFVPCRCCVPRRGFFAIGQDLVRHGLGERELHAINRGNALKLFPRFRQGE